MYHSEMLQQELMLLILITPPSNPIAPEMLQQELMLLLSTPPYSPIAPEMLQQELMLLLSTPPYSPIASGRPQEEPRMIFNPPKNTSASVSPAGEIIEDNSVTLTCSSDANPPVQSYTWYRRRGGAASVVGSQQNYSMTNITSEHSGLYYCMARNQHDLPKTTPASGGPSGEILQGNAVTLNCSSDANPPVQTYMWYKMNESAVSKAAAQQNYSISAVSSEHTGDYYCQAQNKHGNRNSAVIHLNVLLPLVVLAVIAFRCQNMTYSIHYKQYTSVHFKSSRGQEVPLYSTVQMPKPHPPTAAAAADG
ncbi:hypothetical protein ACEWY4_017335 [Coilia grayii]|uniref:Ig-like domain-containing protein n=1 Tax=Coilia grayii TaxID=363190 RepID=A0ABD1JGJ0_9TELE